VSPKSTKATRESESARQLTYGDDHEEASSSSESNTASFTPSEKRIARRETRRRRNSNLETRRQEEGREVEGRRKTGETESTGRTEKKAKVHPRRASNWTPDKGLQQAQSLLNQQALLNQASIRFEQQRGPAEPAMTPFGQQQAMLDSLINMTEMLYHQHTGDKAGEIYNRPATRQILTALKGLKDGAMQGDEQVAEVRAPRRKKREFMAQMARIERVQRSLEPVVLPADYEELDLVA
jgi:hypothetical protein